MDKLESLMRKQPWYSGVCRELMLWKRVRNLQGSQVHSQQLVFNLNQLVIGRKHSWLGIAYPWDMEKFT